ncbi:glycerophosphodiester phosphodiesterase GDPDL7-like isoform X1 [Rosa rugosa]|uniref:glycerophosphodiester phosphodiesterase GDPDL7-like isoform X1 n=2 Tax=Rosa rugosa TaxID=74645 RepID=UPI002B40B2E2|nr:glycerophosphodiester phosphodiesterase GDPDL7-like isoform X1 [Rosa rugosa]
MLESSGKSGEMMRCLLLISLLIHSALAQDVGPEEPPTLGQKGGPEEPPQGMKWLTLNGKEPLIVARGGLSGLFPESSNYANSMAKSLSLIGTALYCNLQLTKDSVGICLSNILLDNTTTISRVHPNGDKTYNVNGKEVHGWFALDFTADQLSKLTLTQNIFSRPDQFDDALPISTVEDVLNSKPDQFWLHVPYDAFYNEHKISPAAFVQRQMKVADINFLSSPEIGFLKTIGGKVDKLKTKLIFEFLGPDEIEPTTKQKYGELLKNLGMIKSLAAGILVPKEFIYPITPNNYLDAPTTLVADAHKEGVEVYAKGFANDQNIPYNYSMDATAEIQQFVDNSDQFSVDGVLTDFPPTASEAIACFSHNKDAKPYRGSPLIISRNGASGNYPGCTDLAYQRAVDDGADIIDCSVQMSSDGVAFCLDSIDLNSGTNALTQFMTKSETIPELQPEAGVFSFQLTWEEIQSLKPQLQSPHGPQGDLYRNPANKDAGKLVTLNEFLEFAKKKATTGILIDIENAPYLASKAGLDIVGTVISALKNASLDKQSTQQVMIKSNDTSVLSKFADEKTYKRVFSIKEQVGSAPKQSIDEIKKFADAVTVSKTSVIQSNSFFISGETGIIKELKAANLSVYIHYLKNEFVSLMFDYLSDPMTEIATYAQGFHVDGIVTDFPGTASKYMKCACTDLNPQANIPYPILPIEPGSLLSLLPPDKVAPAAAPLPALEASSIVDPPLPPVAPKKETKPDSDSPSGDKPAHAPAPTGKSSAFANAANWGVSLVAIMVLSLLSMGN